MSVSIQDSSGQELARDITYGGVVVGKVYHRPESETQKYQACMHSPERLVSAFGWGSTPQEALDDLTANGMKSAVDDCESLVETIHKIATG